MKSSLNSPNFQISSSYEIPESLRQLLYKAWVNHYEELYEEQSGQTITLEVILLKILDALRDKDPSLCHYRYVFMALIIALAVEPTIKAYLSYEPKTEQIFRLIINWLKNGELPTEETINQLFPKESVGSQAIDEALNIFKNLLQVLDPDKAQEALLEILDDFLEGYAIFPGSQGRRDLFNWWLLEVVPATWRLKFPKSLYTIKGIVPFDSKNLPHKLSMFDSAGNISKWNQINNQAVQLMNQGNFDEAQPFATEALKLASEIGKSELIANSYSNLGVLACQKGDFDEAESFYLEALGINLKCDGSESLSVAMVLCSLASLQYEQRLYEHAILYYKQAIKIKKSKLASNHQSLLTSVQNLAYIYSSLRREKEAEELLCQFKLI
ncbi:MAG: tetratricopeptide repeat protein [Cyanobacteria bacterium P01_A01_bin.83]